MGPDLAGTRFNYLVWVEGLGFRVCEMGTLFWGYYLGYYIRVPYNQKPQIWFGFLRLAFFGRSRMIWGAGLRRLTEATQEHDVSALLLVSSE